MTNMALPKRAPSLARLAGDTSQPAIARATALEDLANYPASRKTVEAARAGSD